MLALTLLLLALAAFGHAAFWVGMVNRWHALGFGRSVIKSVTLLLYTALFAPLAWAAWHAFRTRWSVREFWDGEASPLTIYLALCAAYGAAHLAIWGRQRWLGRLQPLAVETGPQYVVDLAQRLGSPPGRGLHTALLGRLPGNQVWQLQVGQFAIAIPGLARELQGLSICHWSDLHLCGRIDRNYFREVVSVTNESPVDLLALTGDICDSASCIEWVPELLGAIKTRLGKYFILGNHDLRTGDVGRLRSAMREAGFTDLGGRALMIADGRILIAGDERPWFKGEPQIPDGMPGQPPLKILLAHTPDRLAWAKQRQFDLLLAGHTHGGQVRFPLIGPVICPSWHGTKYAAGFYHEPPTLLHVSRGTASLFPLRLGCPPEIARLVLRAGR
jgi:hypothetical protein